MDIDIIAKIAATLIASGGICLLFLGCYSMGGVMDRPKKRTIGYKIMIDSTEKTIVHDVGYNQACDECEAFLPTEENIYQDITSFLEELNKEYRKTNNCLARKIDFILLPSERRALAKAISARLRGEK